MFHYVPLVERIRDSPPPWEDLHMFEGRSCYSKVFFYGIMFLTSPSRPPRKNLDRTDTHRQTGHISTAELARRGASVRTPSREKSFPIWALRIRMKKGKSTKEHLLQARGRWKRRASVSFVFARCLVQRRCSHSTSLSGERRGAWRVSCQVLNHVLKDKARRGRFWR